MEKWMIVYLLPLEVWMDILVFPWITREKFGKIVDKIGNFKFSEHAQFYLHEWGKRKLDEVHFRETGLCKYVGLTRCVHLDVPQAPMPENIKSFNGIQIHHFDAKTLDFLDKIRPLLVNVDIRFDISINNFEDFRTILTNLAPILDGIRSLHCCVRKHLKVARLKELKPFSRSNAVLDEGALVQANVNALMDWLTSLNMDGPRMCEIDLSSAEQISMAIRQVLKPDYNEISCRKDPMHICREFDSNLGREYWRIPRGEWHWGSAAWGMD